MKHLSKMVSGILLPFLLLNPLSTTQIYAQDIKVLTKEKLLELELSGLGNKLLINTGAVSQFEVSYFKTLSKKTNPGTEKVTAEEWENLYERLIDTDLRSRNQRMPDFSDLTETNSTKITKNNVIPIGITNLESVYLTDTQIEDNKKIKKLRKSANFNLYDTFDIVYASVLQQDLFQADVLFKLSPKLFITNHSGKISNVEINFNDGKGFKSYPYKEQLIPHTFKSIGKQNIDIKIKLKDKVYTFQTVVDVKQLERQKPFKEFQITAPRVWFDTLSNVKSARTALVGGNIRIILGCDQLLNRAIIIAEGFDMGQDVNLDHLEAKYREAFATYLIFGYDLVLLDYTDARDAMQNNAQVLKALIQQVNTMKDGAEKSIVVGESMSGLVARWALREMEQNSQVHDVKLLICYDTPHQGANIPVGLTQIAWETTPSLLTNVILKFFGECTLNCVRI